MPQPAQARSAARPEPVAGAPLRGSAWSRLLVYAVLIVNLALTGYPFVWMLLSAFKTNMAYYEDPWGLPSAWSFENYARAWELGVKDYLLNSVVITASTVLVQLAVASMIAFYLARRPFRGSGAVLGIFLLGMMLPTQSTLIPLYLMISQTPLMGTLFSLLFPYVGFGLPMAVFLLFGYFSQMPREMEEASMIDGCGLYRSFWHLYLPLSRPILTTVTILSTFGVWNDFVLPLIFISEDSLRTLPLGLFSFRGGYTTEYATISAALVLATLPVIALYLSLQKYIEKGMTAGAVKG
ncbi:carbohydrate ABC transporter permease [Paenibacillus albicereus]|uniref:Carbohydrate ABC transporter permease n=1 Tax=Paenibacillus albicereus TaxID=2726185 RepID=A0A6H2GUZ1_9BACL|nr:carbohydrate ABC transporter permease [Paenibacillus albicereus]QJC50986.1 carbohydrate ABC transporter permease [Paenibacillus albicereus]